MLVFYFYFSFFLLGHKGGGVFITVAGYSKKKNASRIASGGASDAGGLLEGDRLGHWMMRYEIHEH